MNITVKIMLSKFKTLCKVGFLGKFTSSNTYNSKENIFSFYAKKQTLKEDRKPIQLVKKEQ